MRKLTGAIAKSKCAVIFINQIREKIGVMFGSPETTPGGRALKFYCSCRIDVRRIGALKDGEEQVGQRVKAKIVKNKVAPPFRIAEFDMMHTNGISYEGDLLDLGTTHKVSIAVALGSSTAKLSRPRQGEGRNFLIENPEIADEIRSQLHSQ
jgi:recombination protein RecA